MHAYSDRFDRAVALALEAFRSTHRKGNGVPYVTHLLMVTAIVGEHGGDEDQMIAAVLHDYLEDIHGASVADLDAQFGPRVSEMVVALSDVIDEHPKPPWVERKNRYVTALRDKPPEVKLISAADKLHNARTIVTDHRQLGDAIFDRFNPTKDQTLWYYRSCLSALSHDWEHRLLDELEHTVERLHRVSGVPFAPGDSK